jgi:nucleotide-binding universal stress UspA family protein
MASKTEDLTMYQKILVPVDGSDHSMRALKEAINLAKMTDGKITLMHVNRRESPMSRSSNSKDEIIQSNGKSILAADKKIVEAEGLSVDTIMAEGKVAEEIVRTAKEGSFDLVIIGARGLSRVEEIMLGSVSCGVAEKAPCPVIVTK